MFRRKRVHKKSTFPQVREYSQLLKKPFVDKSKWFKEVPAEEWKEAPAPAPTLKPSIASGKLKETSKLSPLRNYQVFVPFYSSK
jgi:hypothetical protein